MKLASQEEVRAKFHNAETLVGTAEYMLAIQRAIYPDIDKSYFLDMGCGEMTLSRFVANNKSVHVDVKDYPARPREFCFVQDDILRSTAHWTTLHYDLVLATDVVEHFNKADRETLLKRMEHMADGAILFMPYGEYRECEPTSTNPDIHKDYVTEKTFPGWNSLVCSNWHETQNRGAFFVWKSFR